MSEPTYIVAEDEELLRAELVSQLATAWPQARLVAECEDGASALDAIAEHAPSAAFLDIRMPGLTGMEVARAAVDASPRTHIVFVTAYDQYAVDAFERGAVDYLLKPISAERLSATVQRLQSRDAPDAAALAALIERLGQSLPRVSSPAEALQWITASAGRETRLIPIEDVIYFRAEHKYTTVVTAEGEALLRTPLRDLLARLDASRFKQVHRSTIVNLRAVAGVTRADDGRGTLRLRGREETLSVSAPFMALFKPH